MRERLRLTVYGAVQGVGFRPFVYRLALRHGLDGWVLNNASGVQIDVEGQREHLDTFHQSLASEAPPNAVIQSLESVWSDPVGHHGFDILQSESAGALTTLVTPDSGTCPACVAEVLEPTNRRYRYPFTNCTNCGPRYSLIESLPYDRPRTSMRAFAMCEDCEREYHNPGDRRFHAQPNACPVCGPKVELWSPDGSVLSSGDAAMRAAADAIKAGQIVAVKGLGGFHLMVRAADAAAVARLRARKLRQEKPFAVMATSVDEVDGLCHLSAAERRLLLSAEAPIVLLRRRADRASAMAEAVAPENPWLGVMLPYTPMHHILLGDVGEAVVATSGNLSDEPICIDEHEALERLSGVADVFLVHNRPIVRHVDDSIVRVQLGRELVLRRARGYAPLPVTLPESVPTLVAVGAHLKNTVAVSVDRQVFISQHIGDLETEEAQRAFSQTLGSLEGLYGVTPVAVATDLHPDYVSTRKAMALGVPTVQVQHHLAHVLSCAAENDVRGPFLGVSWDGTGLGTDGTIWGGEFLLVDDGEWERFACLRPFRLPGGDHAVREPRRSAFGVLQALMGPHAKLVKLPAFDGLSSRQRDLWRRAIDVGVNAPVTSSAGRLFDAVAALAGVRNVSTYEGQAAMELEWAADPDVHDAYPCPVVSGDAFAMGTFEPPALLVDWGDAVRSVLNDIAARVSVNVIAARWHNAMAEAIAEVATLAGRSRVVLSGGCFQNVRLCEQVDHRLRTGGMTPYWHQRVPPNDAGIALGQLMAAVHPRRQLAANESRRMLDVPCSSRTHSDYRR